MEKYQLKITLLSDLCVSDGGVYNSTLDTDICHDELGFPYIPAKRLKGCLRECALELNDWGKEIPIAELFGEKGSKAAVLRLGNAYLEGYEDMRKTTIKYRNTLICHPQNILNHFSYIRTQTSIDYKTGAADNTTLRTIRVAKKGLVFIAEVEFTEADSKEIYYQALLDCCSALRSMGMARTRGLGEIQVVFSEKEEKKNQQKEKCQESVSKQKDWIEGSDYLVYTLKLEEPLICKSVNGGEAKTMDYIEGSKILGLVVEQIKEDEQDISEFFERGEVFCSNGYIEQNKKRMLEVPATFYSTKNEKEYCVDKIYLTEAVQKTGEKEKQKLYSMKHCYIDYDSDGNLIQCDVGIEERYHHSRPEDKSVGRAYEDNSGDSVFYQMSSITAGQVFQGYITGDTRQIEKIYQQLRKKKEYYMGYSRSCEYGKVSLEITDVCKKERKNYKNCKEFTIKLEAPTIIYNSKAMYSTDVKELIAEVNQELGIKNARVNKYINYTTVGGYHVTWNMRKPVIEAFDKGSVLHYHLDQPMDLPSIVLLGERVAEGYGEATITPVETEKGKDKRKIVKADDTKEILPIEIEDSIFLKRICDDLFETFVRIKAVRAAKEYSLNSKEILKPTVSNMILMCKESRTLEEIKKKIEDRFQKKSEKKDHKYQKATDILEKVKTNSQTLLEEFCKRYQITQYFSDQENYQRIYMENYLNGLKYQIRKSEIEKIRKEGEFADGQ